MKNFEKEQLTDRLYRIYMPYVCAYFLIGSKGGLLIDTGWGYGSLKDYIASWYDEPYQVILTHGHCDHGGGAGEFKNVFLPKRDAPLERYSCSLEVRERIMRRVMAKEDFLVEEGHFLPQPAANHFNHYGDGFKLDLGDRSLEAIQVPGHTQGMMALLVPEERICIYGDGVMNGTLLATDSATSLEEHLQGLRHLEKRFEEYDRALISHAPYELPKETLKSNILWTERILANVDDRFQIGRGKDPVYVARHREKDYSSFENMGNIKYRCSKL